MEKKSYPNYPKTYSAEEAELMVTLGLIGDSHEVLIEDENGVDKGNPELQNEQSLPVSIEAIERLSYPTPDTPEEAELMHRLGLKNR